jgi:hypothetical protein
VSDDGWTYWPWFRGPDFVGLGGVFRARGGHFERWELAWTPTSGVELGRFEYDGDPTGERITAADAERDIARLA